MKKKGLVSLVGAGPGDPDLMTHKGIKRLSEADIIFYDNLVNPEILKWSKTSSRKILAGRRIGGSGINQNTLNQHLCREAKKGKRVVRLKGGDPYLFGRGAEEAALLSQKNIDFEVIPGITSGIGCATYAGIPLTERDLSSKVVFLTGHEKVKGALPNIQWRHLIQAVDTIVIYMGLSKINALANKLVQNGLSPTTPCAAIEWGTWPRQRSYVTSLGKIADEVRLRKMGSPAIFIIGKVVNLHHTLNWFEKLPLFGKKIVLTRGASSHSPWRDRLQNLGASVIQIPTIRIQKPLSFEALDACLTNLESFDWIVFTSANGVDAFFERRAQIHQTRPIKNAIAVIGTGTRERLRFWGAQCRLMPKSFTNESLFKTFKKKIKPLGNQRFLLIRSDLSSHLLPQKLKKCGAKVTCVCAYRTTFPKRGIQKSLKALHHERCDFITFTSSSAVANLFKAAKPSQIIELLRSSKVISIGPVTSLELKKHGVRITRQASTYTLSGLIDAIQKC
jgi:uroporphyrinogen III methyltransferase / synthase